MAIALAGTAVSAAGASVTSTSIVTPTVPTGSTGDLLVITVTCADIITAGGAAPLITSSSAALTKVDDFHCVFLQMATFYRFVAGGDATTYTFTVNVGAPLAVIVVRYSGVSTIRTWNQVGAPGGNTSTAASVTMPTSENVQSTDLVLCAVGMGTSSSGTTNATALSTPASWTNVKNQLGATNSLTSSFHCAAAIYSRAAATDTPSVTGSTGQWVAHRLVLSDTAAPVADSPGSGFPFIASTTARTTSSGTISATSVTINVPSGVANGNLLFLFAHASGFGTFTDPTGWTSLGIQDNGYGFGTTSISIDGVGKVWYRVASSEPASYTVTYTFGVASTQLAVTMLAYSGPRSPNPLSMCARKATESASTSGVASTTSVAPYTMINVIPSNLVLIAYMAGNDSTASSFTITSPGSGWTERANITTAVASNFNSGIAVVEKTGGTDTPTATSSVASGWTVFTVVAAPMAVNPRAPQIITAASRIMASTQ